MFANVVVEYPVKSLDKYFTYEVPEELQQEIKIGMKVLIPFGNKDINGIVLGLTNTKPDIEVKKIISIINPDIYLNSEQLELGKFIKEETLCNLITAYQTILPSSLKIKNVKTNYNKYESYIFLNDNEIIVNEYVNKCHYKKQLDIINNLKDGKKLKKYFEGSSLNTLIKNKIVFEEKKQIYRINVGDIKVEVPKMNEEQQKVFDSVDVNNYQTYLLQGVTGSGKTLVYMELVDKVLKSGKTAIVLVPEICLTTQTVERFYKRFASDVAVFHSGLSDGEKYDEYLKIYRGEVKIVVGTRSSIFVPLKDLGIIIIDEEHSDTYKQDSNPRYDAKKVAIFRAKNNNVPLILASATPTFESRARADKGVYKLLKLEKRANNASMPEIKIVDMTEEIKKRNFLFSDELLDGIKLRLLNKEQVILLLNRRGFSTFINCRNCGFVYKCPNCDITMTYHKTSNNLRCHYCGYSIIKDTKCPECHEDSLNFLGLGTEKVEEELNSIFPSARIIRMDQDTTTKKDSYQKIINAFQNKEYDILLGTQMISKGLDFEDVTLVGVINADTSLNIPDFRASEKTFSLLSQTAGRSGRSTKSGEVIIQTYNPDNKIFEYLKRNDFNSFYITEMDIRHKLKYPPYTFITLIKVSSKSYEDASKEVNNIKLFLHDKLDKTSLLLGPTPAPVFRVNNIYTFQLIIKYTFDKNINNLLKKIDENYIENSKVDINIVMDPGRF